jgi:hypothetical protein
MRGALTDRVVNGYVSGRYYGVVGDEVTPLYGVVAATFSRYRQRADGAYEFVSVEQAYFTDLDNKAVLDTYANPYTSETVTVPATQGAPSKLVVGLDLKVRPVGLLPGVELDQRVLPPQVIGGDVWFTEESFASARIPGRDKPIHYTETVTMQATTQALASSHGDRVPAHSIFNSVVSWRPWLKMGDRPGHLLGVGRGAFDVPVSDLPPAWLEATRRLRPQLLTAPETVLAPAWGPAA